MYCSETGKKIEHYSEGIYEDGEWTSWEWINRQTKLRDIKQEFPNADPEVVEIFEDLVSTAHGYFERTGRYLQIWGELGELYAEICFGLKRHKPGHEGSDGRLGNDWIEIKTISPEKRTDVVMVKRAGNFNKILIVKFDEFFEPDCQLIDRKELGKGKGKFVKARWKTDKHNE